MIDAVELPAGELTNRNSNLIEREANLVGSYFPIEHLKQVLTYGIVPEKMAKQLNISFHRTYGSSWNDDAVSVHAMPLTHTGFSWTAETLETVSKIKNGCLTHVMALAKKDSLIWLQSPTATDKDRGNAPPVPSELVARHIPPDQIVGLVIDDVYWRKLVIKEGQELVYSSQGEFTAIVEKTVRHIVDCLDQTSREIPIYSISGKLLFYP